MATPRERAQLFITGFVQVFFVGLNTFFIAHSALWGNLFSAFMISYIWTHNVKRVAFGDEADRWCYATGAMLGSVTGALLAKWALS